MTERGTRRDRLGRIGRREEGEERALDVAGTVEVEGELARPVRSAEQLGGLLPQRFGDPAVQAGALWWEQVGVDHLPEQRMPKAVGIVVDDEQPCVDDRPHRSFDLAADKATIAASNSWLVSRPIVATASNTWRAASSRPAISAEIRSDSTIGIGSPATWAATSSLVKNGLP